jgi:hypothetical protein
MDVYGYGITWNHMESYGICDISAMRWLQYVAMVSEFQVFDGRSVLFDVRTWNLSM